MKKIEYRNELCAITELLNVVTISLLAFAALMDALAASAW